MRIPVALLLVCCAAGCARGKAPTAPEPVVAPSSPVRTAAARAPAAEHPILRLPGLIAPSRNVTISSALSEPVVVVHVKEGDVVRRGQVLAQLDIADLQANLDGARRSAAEADLRAAQQGYQSQLAIVQGIGAWRTAQDGVAQAAAKLRVDRRTNERNQQLFKSGDIPAQQLDESRSLVATDAAMLRSALIALQQARETVGVNGDATRGMQQTALAASRAAASSAHAQATQIAAQLGKATIRAPIDGIVVDRNIEVGEYPGNRTLFTIQDTAKVYAMLSATASQLTGVRPGLPARIVAARTGPANAGVVEAVLGQPTPGATTFTVKVLVPNPSGVLLSGMPVTGILQPRGAPHV